MTRRRTTDQERTLFQHAVDEARPLAQLEPVGRAKKVASHPSSGASGLDGRTDDRLRRGMIKPEARIDLHGFTERDAHHALLLFLRTAQARHHKLALVITGKGARLAPDTPFDMELNYRSRGILKSVVPRWLREPAFAGIVAGARAAHARHGGDGALYVYLRRSG
jgi:DNA-nicking Smr family endonuclease